MPFVDTPFLALLGDDEDEELFDDSFETDAPDLPEVAYESDDEYNPYEATLYEEEELLDEEDDDF